MIENESESVIQSESVIESESECEMKVRVRVRVRVRVCESARTIFLGSRAVASKRGWGMGE